MNTRTKVSTVVAILFYINFAISIVYEFIATNVDVSIFDGHPHLKTAYGIFTLVGTFCAWLNSHYWNQDFTEEACRSTGYMRWLKSIRKGEGVGDGLADEPETDAEEDRLEGDFYE